MNSITQATTVGLHPAARSNFVHVCRASCRRVLAQLKAAKASILAEFRDRLEDHDHVLELALNEAEALAWQSGFPQLLFPTLATEKAQSVAQWHARQRFVREHHSAQHAEAA